MTSRRQPAGLIASGPRASSPAFAPLPPPAGVGIHHEFTGVNLHADGHAQPSVRVASATPFLAPPGLQRLAIRADPLSPTGPAADGPQSGEADDPGASPGGPSQLQNPAGDCPYDAVHMGFRLGAESGGCQVPAGQLGVKRMAYFKIVTHGSPMPTKVDERFTTLEDSHGVAAKLKPQSGPPNNGIFDDCFMIATPNGLPPDFRLKVQQNHLIAGQIASQNQITYTADHIDFCQSPRIQGACTFSARCKH